MDLPDLTAYTDDDLRTLGDAVAAERDRRTVLAQAVTQGIALAQQYKAAGGNVDDALAQIAAAVTGETTDQPPASS